MAWLPGLLGQVGNAGLRQALEECLGIVLMEVGGLAVLSTDSCLGSRAPSTVPRALGFLLGVVSEVPCLQTTSYFLFSFRDCT